MADKKIDPRLYIPLVEGYSYDDPILELNSVEGVQVVEPPVEIDEGLQPPSSIYVVDQIYRKGADGRVVVDLVLEVEDMPGAQEYEVRVAAV